MKTILFISTLLFSVAANAQLGVPFPTDTASWVTLKTDYNPGATMFTRSAIQSRGEDTTIASLTFTKLYQVPGNTSFGAFREENSKIYLYSYSDGADFLMYDFNLVAGDSTNNMYYISFETVQLMPFQLVVGYIDTVNYNGMDRKRINFQQAQSWIEGIGCESGLFQEPYWNVSMYSYSLECFSENQTSIYPNFVAGNCSSTLTISEIESDISYTVYPNPTSGSIKIESEKLPNESLIRVTDLKGKIMQDFKFTSPASELNLNFSSGVYFVAFPEASGSIPTRIVIL